MADRPTAAATPDGRHDVDRAADQKQSEIDHQKPEEASPAVKGSGAPGPDSGLTMRQGKDGSGGGCSSTKKYVHPKVAFSVKGHWLYVVNLPGVAEHQQGILTVECT